MKERVGVKLTADQAASLLVCQGGDRKPSTVAASAARKGRSKYDRKQVPCACDRDCGKFVTTPDANGKERRYYHGHHPKRVKPKAEPREVPCACGCGETVVTPNRYGRQVRYRHGHHGKRKQKPKIAEAPRQPVRGTRRPTPIDEEPETEVVWSGRDPLTPPPHRLSEETY